MRGNYELVSDQAEEVYEKIHRRQADASLGQFSLDESDRMLKLLNYCERHLDAAHTLKERHQNRPTGKEDLLFQDVRAHPFEWYGASLLEMHEELEAPSNQLPPLDEEQRRRIEEELTFQDAKALERYSTSRVGMYNELDALSDQVPPLDGKQFRDLENVANSAIHVSDDVVGATVYSMLGASARQYAESRLG